MMSSKANTMAEPENEPSTEPRTAPEPLPDWDLALKEWSALWEIHFIGFGILFIGVALFSCFCLVRIKAKAKSMSMGNYFLAVCFMLMVFSVSRTFFLLLDPYESHSVLNLPVVVVRILFAIGYPCITSALSLIHFAFIEVNKLRLISRRLQNVKFLVSVIAVHFVVVLVVYLVITYSPKLARLLILCQTVLIAWWLVLSLCFLYSAWKVSWESRITAKFFKTTKERSSSTLSSCALDPAVTVDINPPKDRRERQLSKGAQKIARISGIVAILALVNVAIELYSLFALYKLYNLDGDGSIDHWSWWGYQTSSRIVDLLFCAVIAYVIYPSTQAEKKHSHSFTGGTNSSVSINRNTAVRVSGMTWDRSQAV